MAMIPVFRPNNLVVGYSTISQSKKVSAIIFLTAGVVDTHKTYLLNLECLYLLGIIPSPFSSCLITAFKDAFLLFFGWVALEPMNSHNEGIKVDKFWSNASLRDLCGLQIFPNLGIYNWKGAIV
jgi:hypothetical protein